MTPDDRSYLRRALLRRGGDLATRLAEVMAGQDAERIVRALGLNPKPGARPDELLRRALAEVEELRRWLEADDPRYGACAICATRFSIEQLRELPWADRCPAHAGTAAAAH